MNNDYEMMTMNYQYLCSESDQSGLSGHILNSHAQLHFMEMGHLDTLDCEEKLGSSYLGCVHC